MVLQGVLHAIPHAKNVGKMVRAGHEFCTGTRSGVLKHAWEPPDVDATKKQCFTRTRTRIIIIIIIIRNTCGQPCDDSTSESGAYSAREPVKFYRRDDIRITGGNFKILNNYRYEYYYDDAISNPTIAIWC